MYAQCSAPCAPNPPQMLPLAPDCFVCASTPVPPLPLVANIVSVSASSPAVVTISPTDAPAFAGSSSVTIAGTGNLKLDKQHLSVVVAGSSIALTGVNNSAGPAVDAVGTVTTP